MAEPASAPMTAGIAGFSLTKPPRMKRNVAAAVPTVLESLFVAIAVWAGKPASRYAVRETSPPPPAMASTTPARNTSGQTMMSVIGSMEA